MSELRCHLVYSLILQLECGHRRLPAAADPAGQPFPEGQAQRGALDLRPGAPTFNVAIAEVEDQDVWQVAGLGFAVVSADGRHADRMVAEIVDFIERRAEAQLGAYEVEQVVL